MYLIRCDMWMGAPDGRFETGFSIFSKKEKKAHSLKSFSFRAI